MSDKITYLNNTTTQDIPCERVISGLDADSFKDIFVLGWDKDNNLFAASNTSDVGELFLLFETWKNDVLNRD